MADETDFSTSPAEPEVPVPTPTPSSTVSPAPAEMYQGNSYDMAALVGVISGALVLLSCGTLGLGTYCLPLLPLILGVIGLVTAKDAVNPDRTRLMSWISIGIGGVIFLLIILLVLVYAGFIFFAVASEGNF